MDELMDMMATDESPSQISDKIKEILFNKSAERVDAFKTDVANGVFGDVDVEDEELDDEIVDLDAIIFLIGLQELGQFQKKFSKQKKLEIIHIAICKLLSIYGYYKLDFIDDEGWPHYTLIKKLPNLKPGEQTILIKKAIINYFDKSDYIH